MNRHTLIYRLAAFTALAAGNAWRRLRGPRHIDAPTLMRRLESSEALTLLDVRTADEFRAELGHIAGAINIAMNQISARLSDLTANKAPIITI
jgi:rhodanese-related sulfurtransferase